MDDPAANPEYYRDSSPAEAVAQTARLIREVEAMRADAPQGVWPVITPRFIPSCTDEVLRGLGNLAAEHDSYVQSHCNEGQWEHDTVLARFGKEDPYALRAFGLLREHSIMAHCTFLTPDEGELFAQVGAGIAHCPISNAYFASSVLPVKRLHEQGVRIGLGTDISGGFSPNMYDDIRQAVMASRMLETGVDAQKPEAERGSGDARISVVEALYLATAGGAEALGLPVGLLIRACLTRTSPALVSSTPRRTAWRGYSTSRRPRTSVRSTCRVTASSTNETKGHPLSHSTTPPRRQSCGAVSCWLLR